MNLHSIDRNQQVLEQEMAVEHINYEMSEQIEYVVIIHSLCILYDVLWL
jgi:hypothetical protein